MKKWTQREADQGAAVSPGAINDEMRAQQSSITTLDRAQLPSDFVDEARLELHALHRVWVADRWGSTGEQTAAADASIPTSTARGWRAASYQTYSGGWQAGSAGSVTLPGFKGGHLFIDWSGNSYVFGALADGVNAGLPGNPKYMRLRIVVSGVVLAERRGPAYHEHWRIFGTGIFPPGDLVVDFQWRLIEPSIDDALEVTTGEHIMQGHVYSQKYLAVGRFR